MSVFRSAFTSANRPKRRAVGGFRPLGTVAQGLKPKTAPNPAPNSAPNSAPTPVVAPWDSAFESTRSTLDLNRNSSLAGLAARRTQARQDYGINEDGSENTTDPYSRLATLKADYAKIKRGSSANLAGAGFGYDGSFQNQVNADQEGESRGRDSLMKAFNAQMADYNQQEVGIGQQYNTDLTNAGNSRIDKQAAAVADGSNTVYAPSPRRDAVLKALAGRLRPQTRARLMREAQKEGWV